MTSNSIPSRNDRPSPPTVAAAVPRWLTVAYQLDGAGSSVLGVVLALAPGWLASGLVVAPAAVRGLGLVLVLNGLLNAWVARTPTRAGMLATVVVDVVFGSAVLLVAVADPFGSALWAWWLAAITGVLSLDLAGLKAFGRTRAGR